MANNDENKEINAKVISCQDNSGDGYYEIIINKGAEDGIKSGQRFLIYEIGNEIIDPDTNESLGFLEIVKGVGEVKHIQSKMTTLRSMEKEYIQGQTIQRSSNRLWGMPSELVKQPTQEVPLPFKNVKKGDLGKLL